MAELVVEVSAEGPGHSEAVVARPEAAANMEGSEGAAVAEAPREALGGAEALVVHSSQAVGWRGRMWSMVPAYL